LLAAPAFLIEVMASSMDISTVVFDAAATPAPRAVNNDAAALALSKDSSITVAELVGITRNPDGEPYFDNMVVHCLVTIRVVKGEQELYGACKETDKDGDSTSTTFDSKAHYFIGGTGKYKGITGQAPFTVESLPAPGENLGALIIPHEVTWKIE
jgi:hypothetical protein